VLVRPSSVPATFVTTTTPNHLQQPTVQTAESMASAVCPSFLSAAVFAYPTTELNRPSANGVQLCVITTRHHRQPNHKILHHKLLAVPELRP